MRTRSSSRPSTVSAPAPSAIPASASSSSRPARNPLSSRCWSRRSRWRCSPPRPSRSSTASPRTTPRSRRRSRAVVPQAGLREPTVPLFRARLIGLGFEPDRELVLIELRERSSEDEEEGERCRRRSDRRAPDADRRRRPTDEDEEGYVARIYATRAQVRAMAAKGAEAVAARPAAVPAVRHADGPRRAPVPPLELSDADAGEVLARGELEVRRPHAVVVERHVARALARADGVEVQAIYKPRRGERPLWDFPSGTLCQREVAAYELSRRARLGHRAADRARATARSASGWCSGSSTTTPRSTTSRCSRRTRTASAQFAVFDVLANNADRKGGHCLREPAQRRDRRHRPRPHVPSGVEAAHRDLGLRRRGRCPAARRRRVPGRGRARRRPARRGAHAACLAPLELDASATAPTSCSWPGASPTPTPATTRCRGRWCEPLAKGDSAGYDRSTISSGNGGGASACRL